VVQLAIIESSEKFGVDVNEIAEKDFGCGFGIGSEFFFFNLFGGLVLVLLVFTFLVLGLLGRIGGGGGGG
jgi:hypothetical protein